MQPAASLSTHYVTGASAHSPCNSEEQTQAEISSGKPVSAANFCLALIDKILTYFKLEQEYEKARKDCRDIYEQQKNKKESSLAELEAISFKKNEGISTIRDLLEVEEEYRGARKRLEVIYFDSYMADLRFEVCMQRFLDLSKKRQILRNEIVELVES